MKTMMTVLGLAIAAAPLAGCYVAPGPGYGGPVAYQAPPPPRPVVVVQPRPVVVVAPRPVVVVRPRPVIVVGQPRRVWIAGHYNPYGNWIPGHWA